MITSCGNRKDSGQLAPRVKVLGSALVSHLRLADLIYGIPQAKVFFFFFREDKDHRCVFRISKSLEGSSLTMIVKVLLCIYSGKTLNSPSI